MNTEIWSKERAAAWRKEVGWLVGANFTPATAVNQLEMWQAETWNPARIALELGWARDIGFNSMRVFLHNLAWQQVRDGFLSRMDEFLVIASERGIKIMFVIFDSCWNPDPQPGPQPQPKPGVHNSHWLQSPGREIFSDAAKFAALEPYVVDVVTRFKDDPRVICWDVWNEPANHNTAANPDGTAAAAAAQGDDILLQRLPLAFSWVRSAAPSQPLTSCVWNNDYDDLDTAPPAARLTLGLCDIITYHCYLKAADQRKKIEVLETLGRPILCTEYMARTVGSVFEDTLPVFKEKGVGAYNWGFVAGKTQTYIPWQGFPPGDESWLHDVLRTDGTPYSQEEMDFLKRTLKS